MVYKRPDEPFPNAKTNFKMKVCSGPCGASLDEACFEKVKNRRSNPGPGEDTHYTLSPKKWDKLLSDAMKLHPEV